MFGEQASGGGRRGAPRAQQRTADMQHVFQVSLGELYTGVAKEVSVRRNVVQKPGGGRQGDGSAEVITCQMCGGTGVVVQTVQSGPFIQQMQSKCPACGGQGHTVAAGVKVVR